jgi:hypothetical protein
MIGDAYVAAQRKRRALLNAGSRIWGPYAADGYDQRFASHEAGHVVTSFLLGLDPTFATIEGSGDGDDGCVRFGSVGDQTFDHAVFAMAGVESERLFGFEDDGGGKNDLKQARAAISCSSDDVTIADARRRARRLLKANRAALVAITIALLTKRSLDAAAIAAIMAEHVDDDDDADDGDDSGKVDFQEAMAIRKLVYYQRA